MARCCGSSPRRQRPSRASDQVPAMQGEEPDRGVKARRLNPSSAPEGPHLTRSDYAEPDLAQRARRPKMVLARPRPVWGIAAWSLSAQGSSSERWRGGRPACAVHGAPPAADEAGLAFSAPSTAPPGHGDRPQWHLPDRAVAGHTRNPSRRLSRRSACAERSRCPLAPLRCRGLRAEQAGTRTDRARLGSPVAPTSPRDHPEGGKSAFRGRAGSLMPRPRPVPLAEIGVGRGELRRFCRSRVPEHPRVNP